MDTFIVYARKFDGSWLMSAAQGELGLEMAQAHYLDAVTGGKYEIVEFRHETKDADGIVSTITLARWNANGFSWKIKESN